MSSEKKTRGRQKIEMKKISNESNLQVTFSKRRSGLFKNASELCTLCGANVALILFSPSDKVFSFDHPNVMTVIDRYLSRGPHQNDGTMQFNETRRNTIVQNLNDLLSEMNNRIDIEKRSCDEMSHVHNMNEAQYCGGCLIDRMNMVQLELRENALKELKILVDQQAHRLAIQEPQTLPFFAANGSSSNMLLQPNPQQAKMFMEQSFPINHNPPTQTLPFFTASGSSSNMSLDHQSNPQLAQMFLKQSFPVIQNPVTQTLPFFDGNGSSSNMPPNHQPNSQQAQMFMEQSFENHMLKSNLFGFNNIGGQGGGGGEDPSHFD